MAKRSADEAGLHVPPVDTNTNKRQRLDQGFRDASVIRISSNRSSPSQSTSTSSRERRRRAIVNQSRNVRTHSNNASSQLDAKRTVQPTANSRPGEFVSPTHEAGGQESEPASKQEELRKKEAEEDAKQGKDFLSRLILFYELLKLEKQLGDGEQFPSHLQVEWNSICRKALEPEMQNNATMKSVFGISWTMWLAELEDAHQAAQRVDHHKSQLQELVADIDRIMEALKDEYSLRAIMLLRHLGEGRPSFYEPNFNEADYSVVQAKKAVEEARQRAASVRDLLTSEEAGLQAASQLPLNRGEQVLTEAQLLDDRELYDERYPWTQAKKPANHGQHDIQPQRRRDDISRSSDIIRDNRRREMLPGASYTGRPVRHYEDDPVPSIQGMLQEHKRHELDKAARAHQNAATERQRHRDGYRQALADFLRDKKSGRVMGSREDFDVIHLIQSREKTEQEDVTLRQYEWAKKEAKRVGAFADCELTSDFGDPDYEGQDETIFETPDIVWEEEDKMHIEKWAKDRRQMDVENEDQWQPYVGSDGSSSGGVSLAPLTHELDAEDRAYGKSRLMIDDWEQHRNELRVELNLARFRQTNAQDDKVSAKPPLHPRSQLVSRRGSV